MRVIFADLETTGLDPTRHHLWEIALIVRDPGVDDVEYCWQVRPDLTIADPMALKISGYYRRSTVSDDPVGTVRNIAHPDFPDQAGHVIDMAAELAVLLDGAVLAAANVGSEHQPFDAAFLARFLRAHGQAPAWDHHLLEVESYAAGALGMLPPWKLATLAVALGVPLPDNCHEALEDARLVRDVFDAARLRAGGAG